MKLRVFGTVNDSIVDGPGLRYTVFTQGCTHQCVGCHNPQSHDLQGGYEINIQDILIDIDNNPLLDGVTFSGGEPFLQVQPLIELAKEIKKRGLHLMIYSGYTYEELMEMDDSCQQLLSLCDTLVDGRFVLSLRSLSLLYKGSSNQRIIRVQDSLKQHTIIEQRINDYGEFVE